jgi:hypothetical protein
MKQTKTTVLMEFTFYWRKGGTGNRESNLNARDIFDSDHCYETRFGEFGTH